MGTRVIHARIDSVVLAKCIRLAGGSSIPSGTSLGQAVLLAIDSMVELAEQIGLVGDVNEQSARAVIAELESRLLRPIEPFEREKWPEPHPVVERAETQLPDIPDKRQHPPKEARAAITDPVKAHDIAEAVKRVTSRGAEIPTLEVNPQARAPTTKQIVNLNTIKARSISDLLSEAPGDSTLNEAKIIGGDREKATAIIYTNIPKSMWGSEKAAQMIEDLLNRAMQ